MEQAAFGLFEVERVDGVPDVVGFRPAPAPEETPGVLEGFAGRRVVFPDKPQAFAQSGLEPRKVGRFGSLLRGVRGRRRDEGLFRGGEDA